MPQLSPSSGLMIFIFSFIALILVSVTITMKLPWYQPSEFKDETVILNKTKNTYLTQKFYF